MSMEYITIGLVCILGFFITYMYLKSKKNKETAKSPQQAKVAKIQTVEDLPKPVQNALKQPVGSILTGVSHHIKPIICPECIAEQTRKMNLEKENGAQPEVDEITDSTHNKLNQANDKIDEINEKIDEVNDKIDKIK